MVAWPATLPQAASLGGAGELQSNVVSFTPEVGPPIERRRSSIVNRTHEISFAALTQAQYETFVQFFDVDLFSGTLPFDWVNPMTDAPARVKIVQRQGERAYSEQRITPDLYKLNFTIMLVR